MVRLLTPIYFARVVSFVNRTKEMTNEQAEAVVEEQAQIFETMKPYLLKRWNDNVILRE